MDRMQPRGSRQQRTAFLASLAAILVLLVPLDAALAQESYPPGYQRGTGRAYEQKRTIQQPGRGLRQPAVGQPRQMAPPTGGQTYGTPAGRGQPPVVSQPGRGGTVGRPMNPGQINQPRVAQPPGTPGGTRVVQPGRGQGYPRGDGPVRGGGGWRPGRAAGVGAAIGLGLGVLGAIGRATAAPPVYEQPEYEQPRRPRYPRQPVYIEPDDIDDEPVIRRPRPRPVVARPETPLPRVQRAAPSGGGTQPPSANNTRPAPSRFPPVSIPVVAERRLVADEVLVEVAGDAGATQGIATRHRLTLLSSERFTLANATLSRFRVDGGRSARTVLAEMAGNPAILTAQPNYVYTLQQGAASEAEKLLEAARLADPLLASVPAAPAEIRPPDLPEAPVAAAALPLTEKKPQYVPERIGLDAAHRVARGERVRVAVIDSGADRKHPELEGTIARSFDAVGGDNPQPHQHGTAMTAAIMARSGLQGIAPAAELLSARAFSGGATGTGAEGTTIHILKSLDWASAEGARVVNLSFAGPQDRLLSRALEAARARGMIIVAAAGNGGPQAAALYPGADPNVIAVTATDADDKAFPQANRGSYVALAAPGVDVLAAAPQAAYAFSSGTSIAAAHVSGLVALMLERRPDLDMAQVRAILSETAIDLGAKGKDPVFGAGRINAPAALARTVSPTTARR